MNSRKKDLIGIAWLFVPKTSCHRDPIGIDGLVTRDRVSGRQGSSAKRCAGKTADAAGGCKSCQQYAFRSICRYHIRSTYENGVQEAVIVLAKGDWAVGRPGANVWRWGAHTRSAACSS